jgi:hypothetical protein
MQHFNKFLAFTINSFTLFALATAFILPNSVNAQVFSCQRGPSQTSCQLSTISSFECDGTLLEEAYIYCQTIDPNSCYPLSISINCSELTNDTTPCSSPDFCEPSGSCPESNPANTHLCGDGSSVCCTGNTAGTCSSPAQCLPASTCPAGLRSTQDSCPSSSFICCTPVPDTCTSIPENQPCGPEGYRCTGTDFCCPDEASCNEIPGYIPPEHHGGISPTARPSGPPLNKFDLCDFTKDNCAGCPEGSGVPTALGCIPTNTQDFVVGFLRFALGIGGGIAFLLMLYGVLVIITSGGSPERVAGGQQTITAALGGLLFIIFSVVILNLVGFQILQIPGF